MKISVKNTIIAMVAGTFIIAAATNPFIAQAAETQQPLVGQHQKHEKVRQIKPEQIVQRLSTTFGIDQANILHYSATGMSFKDISRAAFLANASGKSLDEVISHKTPENKWRDVATTMGITKEQMQATRQSMVANHLNTKIGLDKQVTLDLLHQGYKAQDIGIASELAKNSNKSITEVLSLKKINNRWSDVANTLGIDKETLTKDMKELGFGHKRHNHSM